MAAVPTPPETPIRIGTRRSNLAVVQAEGIRDSLQKIEPHRFFEIVTLRPLGDRDKTTALYEMGVKNLWTCELEEKLVSGELDLVVHCLKDMPTALPETCELASIPPRDDPRDALIVKAGLPYTSLSTLPDGAVIGTSSVRRSAQLRRLYPRLNFANLRGNVETRLAKVDDPNSEYTCMIMSTAGLERVGLRHRINQCLQSSNGGMYHAVGQGALGLEIRKGDAQMHALLNQLADRRSTLACLAERSLLRTLEGGCSVPIGVETEWVETDTLHMRSIVVSLDGAQSAGAQVEARLENPEEAVVLGQELAAKLVEAGAQTILDAIIVNRPAKE
ncbi:Porphobilinogen deaminase [Penicillium diatomitis]|uniref:Porphobilinogen deaminase n=1 Tax=Penicillium diatomitis TaxID=2819901 RepID=A0A9X0BV17_9EURO|nr:Porphobilinogen deaminase [Penicillium diatomitis]KAJ5485522.1 Porphobilinogen deaminase [Penicillium diatomitis]